MLQEFKKFALQGNVIDLAVGVIIGGAFSLIVNSVVADVFTPIVGMAFKADFRHLYYPLTEGVADALRANPNLSLSEARTIGPVLAWGNFITEVANFIILAFIIFMMVRAINSLKKKEEVKPTAPADLPPDVKLLTEIRDLLKAK